jgi:hypothetical protein
MGGAKAKPVEMSLVDIECESTFRSGRFPGNTISPSYRAIREVFSWEACSLFILEKGKPVVRSGRKAVDLDRLTKRRGSLVTERMTVCHAR